MRENRVDTLHQRYYYLHFAQLRLTGAAPGDIVPSTQATGRPRLSQFLTFNTLFSPARSDYNNV